MVFVTLSLVANLVVALTAILVKGSFTRVYLVSVSVQFLFTLTMFIVLSWPNFIYQAPRCI
ncbi:hypothetical protein A9Q99_13965 [Gammaproteobacteria bacterium 45_16_T64]|nr:hypothetical protein A9Q99_13965 [Gammaproteobacteria bacterium 45_16_T64]